jgi:hypothetical protein
MDNVIAILVEVKNQWHWRLVEKGHECDSSGYICQSTVGESTYDGAKQAFDTARPEMAGNYPSLELVEFDFGFSY